MTTNTYLTPNVSRWTQRFLASLSCAAVVGCGGGGGDSGTAAPAAAAPAPAPATQLASSTTTTTSTTVSGSSAAIMSPERYHPLVHQLYLAYYGRPPDAASRAAYALSLSVMGGEPSLTTLTTAYATNLYVRKIIDEFAQSAEFKSLYGSTTEQLVSMAFQTLLARAPDASGKQYWIQAINSGAVPRALAVLAIMNSASAADQPAIQKKLEASSKFTEALSPESGKFLPNAIVTGRVVLGGVDGSTTSEAIDSKVAAAADGDTPPVNDPVPVYTPPSGAITSVRFENTSRVAQTNVPVTFGQIFAQGHFQRGETLVGQAANGAQIPLQVDVKASHADGSVRHAVISAVLPSLAPAETAEVHLLKGAASTQLAQARPAPPADFSSRIELTLDGVQYSADLAGAVAAGTRLDWLNGPIASETIYAAALKSASGMAHPHLTVRFGVRTYANSSNPVRLELIVENNHTFAPGARNFTYAVKWTVNGREAYANAAQIHYHHARWRKLAWSGAEAPPVYVRHNGGYIIASKAVPNYDQSIVPDNKTLDSFLGATQPMRNGPMKIGPALSSMHTTGGRMDIGPLPGWSVMYLLSMDRRAHDAMMAAADGSGSWSIHLRDEATGYPVRTDNAKNATISTHGNMNKKGPLPVPRCANDDWSLCDSPFKPDVSHQPSLAYLPYLVTGDYYYLEELQFWAAWNPLGTAAGNHGNGKGLVRWMQVRGQAWSLRTLGQAAYITPDNHYLKGYFNTQVDNNLAFYHATYVVGNPNALGVYDGSGEGSHAVTQSAPWQDDYFTWSFGYLAELGYSKAQPILQWKGKYSVGRMTAPGYCWIEGAPYWMKYRDSSKTPIYKTFAELYAANFHDKNVIDNASHALTHPAAASYTALACGSAEQAAWRTAATKSTWLPGQMTGYSSSNLGYPSNMQIALAVVANSGIPNAKEAWTIFNNRSVKPDYHKGPQFAVVPR